MNYLKSKNQLRRTLVAMLSPLLLSACVLPGYKMAEQSTDNEFGWYKGVEQKADNANKVDGRLQVIELNAETIFQQDQYRSVDYALPSEIVPNQSDDDYSYKIGARDVLTIIVWGHPDLTIPAGEFRSEESSGRRVAADGTIFFPFAGIVKVAGKTPNQVRSIVARKLRPFIKDPQVDVRVALHRSQRVYVTGEVNQPGTQYLGEEPPRLLDIIGRAGGLAPNADRRVVSLTRNGQSFELDLDSLYREGNAELNVLLKHGDTVHIPDNRATRVFVMGEVDKQQAVPMLNGKLSLADALADVSGINLDTADASRIYVMRGIELVSTPGGEQRAVMKSAIFQLNAASPDALVLADRFELQPRDIVYVSSTPLTRWNRLIAQILPSVSVLFQSTAFIRAVD